VISCAEAVEQLWMVLEDAIPEPERASVEDHLAFCRRCCGEAEFAEQLRGLLAQAAEVDVPPEVERRLFTALDEVETIDAGDEVVRRRLDDTGADA
jgi:anti-sigma factor (TIGR02949 family)